MAAAANTSNLQEVQLYPEKTALISKFWKEKYENDAKKYWDMFYKRNANRFFKDRHYLDNEWGQYFSCLGVEADPPVAQTESDHAEEDRVILEIGCGIGNTVYPLIAKYPQAYVYACDFSPRAVDLAKALGVALGRYTVHAKCLPKENQHTYASTGFMLWGSAYAFAKLLATNPHLIKGKSGHSKFTPR